MSNSTKIYHNPRCSKSRKALEILQEKETPFECIEYLKNPPSVEDLDQICQLLDLHPQEIIRTKEKLFTELNLSIDDSKTREEWLRLLVDHPILIERPIILNQQKAVIGRPPEKIHDLFN